MNSRPELQLNWCSHAAAKYACEKWHYSGVLPAGKLARIGVWEAAAFAGAIVFSPGANRNLLNPYGLTQLQGCELIRIALGNHKAPTSRIVAIAMKLLAAEFGGLRLVVSFADPVKNHRGCIYQAMNWIYTGTGDSSIEYLIDGRWCRSRVFRSSDWSKYSGIDYLSLPRRKTEAKHRYLMPLDTEMRARIEPLRKPYPKRATRVDSDPPAIHAGEGGASPTVALSVRESDGAEFPVAEAVSSGT